ncbi:MAG: hypothetical protein EBV00_01135 [Burkholderiaceae bacterium]|nr:hypothetical protein [Burkholderiaceae bacterium]
MPLTLRQKAESSVIRARIYSPPLADFCLSQRPLHKTSLVGDTKVNLPAKKRLSLISYNYLPLVFFTAFFSLLRVSTAQVLEFRIVPDTNLPILDSSGSAMRTNLSFQLGTFTNSTNAVQVLSLIGSQTNQSQIAALMVSNYYSIFTTNQWTNTAPLRVPNLSIPTNISIGGTNLSTNIPIYIMIFNNTNPASATEMGIFRARSTSTNNQTNAFFPSSSNGRIVLSGGDGTNTTNTALKLGAGVLFGQTINGQLRLAPIGPPNQILTTNLVAFQGLTSSLQLKANNGPTSFSVMASNGGVTSSLSILGLTNSNGVIVGEPLTNAIGTNTLVVSATNADGFAGSVTSNVSLIVRAQNGPNFTNASRFTNIAGISNSFTFLTDAPDPSVLQFTALDSLPTDSTLSTSGVLTTSNTSAGTNLFRILVTDTSSGDVRALNFTNVTILPSIFIEGTNSSGELELVANKPFTNRITYTPGYLPTNITSSPGGTFRNLTVTTNSGNYYLSGTSSPTVMRTNDSPETNTISASAANRVSAELKLPIVFVNAAPALVTNRYTWILSETTNQVVEATGSPTFTASDLPVVVTGNISTNGLITVTTNPAVLTNVSQAVWTSTIVMNNLGGVYRGGGRTTSSVVITLTNPIPSITSTNRLFLSIGRAASYTLTATGNPAVFEFLDQLPSGLTARGARIEGTPTQVVATNIRCRVSNFGLPGDSSIWQPSGLNLSLYVAANKPASVAYSSPENLVAEISLPPDGSAFIDTSTGVNVSAYGLPPGLSVDRATGNLLGTPTTPGTYSATVFIQNAKGWIKKIVSLTVR